MQGIDNLIIDLGGVLYAIDIQISVAAFSNLMGGGRENLEKVAYQMHHNSIWKEFEKGVIGKDAFRQGIRDSLEVQVDDQQIDDAWNALLIEPIEGRAELLAQLGRKYRLILLSNTNAIHFGYLAPHSQHILSQFETQFLSYEMGARKPDVEIYQIVLDSGLRAERSLFIDDSEMNIQGAQSLGINSIHVEPFPSKGFTELFTDLI